MVFEQVFEAPGYDTLTAEAAGIPNGTGKFWQITAPDGAISHLWGTLHSADLHILRQADQMRDVIESARVVAVEIDFTYPTREAYRAGQYIPERYNDATDPFEQLAERDATIAGVSPEVTAWILDRALELGWTEDADLILSPQGMAEMLLSDPCEDFTARVTPIQDDYIALMGRVAGAQVLGLESPDAFFSDLDDLPLTADAIVAVYGAYLKPVRNNRARSTAFAIYAQGRLGLMQTWDKAFLNDVLGSAMPKALERTDDYLLDFRNQRFLEALADELPKGGVFIAVGSGHLPGENGLVEMLRRAGYTLKRLPLPGEVQ